MNRVVVTTKKKLTRIGYVLITAGIGVSFQLFLFFIVFTASIFFFF